MAEEDKLLENFKDDRFYSKEYKNMCSLCKKQLFPFKKKIGLYSYCSSCKDFILECYKDIEKTLMYKFYFVFWHEFSHHSNIVLSNYSKDKNFDREFIKNFSLEIDKDIIKIKFKNYQVRYSPDNRLTLENQMINKRQHFNSSVFWDLHTILLSLESLPLWFYNASGHSFSSEYCSNPTPKIDIALSKYKEIVIEYEDLGMNSKGEDVPVAIAKIKVDLGKLKSKNIPNILEKDRWDLFSKLIDFRFNKFPTGVDGYVGDYGDIEDYTHRQSIGIDINSDILESNCPFCDVQRQINLKDIPKKGESINWFCEECEQSADFSLPEESYVCPFCNKDYDSLATKMKHIKVCKERLKNIIKCSKCKLEVTLDEDELQELEKNGVAKISCPCKNKFSVKRKNNKLEII